MTLNVQREMYWVNRRVAWLLEKDMTMQAAITQAIEEQMDAEEQDPGFRRRLRLHTLGSRFG